MSTLTPPTVRDKHITAALEKLNEVKGLKYRDVGYAYYADIKGDGQNNRRIWKIINEGGGVTRSDLNRSTMRETLQAIQQATIEADNAFGEAALVAMSYTSVIYEDQPAQRRTTLSYRCYKTSRTIRLVVPEAASEPWVVASSEFTTNEVQHIVQAIRAYNRERDGYPSAARYTRSI